MKGFSSDLSIKTSFVWNEKLFTARALSRGFAQRIKSESKIR